MNLFLELHHIHFNHLPTPLEEPSWYSHLGQETYPHSYFYKPCSLSLSLSLSLSSPSLLHTLQKGLVIEGFHLVSTATLFRNCSTNNLKLFKFTTHTQQSKRRMKISIGTYRLSYNNNNNKQSLSLKIWGWLWILNRLVRVSQKKFVLSLLFLTSNNEFY